MVVLLLKVANLRFIQTMLNEMFSNVVKKLFSGGNRQFD